MKLFDAAHAAAVLFSIMVMGENVLPMLEETDINGWHGRDGFDTPLSDAFPGARDVEFGSGKLDRSASDERGYRIDEEARGVVRW